MVLDISVNKIGERTKGALYLVLVIIQALFITLIHLVTFSLVLYGFSILFHDNPMTLLFVLYEKLSTRLYIAMSIYSALSGIAVYVKHRRSQQKSQSEEKPKTITVKKGKSSVFVDIDEIKWINSDGAYLDIYTTHKKHVVLDSLKSIIKTLPSKFKRIHKSTIVNIEWIKKLESRGNGDYDVILDDGHQLRLSRNYTKELRGNLL
jgi:two-component system LytT family response regulator